jgi:CHAD domain-containing protein
VFAIPDMRSQAVRPSFRSRLETLDRDLEGVFDHDVEAVHRTRVASRRIREALPVIGADDRRARDLRRTRATVRQLTRALGGVRELDVSIAILEDFGRRFAPLQPATLVVRELVERERTARRAEMTRRLNELKPERLAERLTSLAGAATGRGRADRVARLRGRLARRAGRLEAAVSLAGALYAFDRLHQVRIAAKKLRYVLELVQELAHVGTRRLVKPLTEAQDLLGRLHDLEVVAGYVRWAAAGAPRESSGALKRLLAQIEREARERHADYLGVVSTIGEVVAACRGTIDRRLGVLAAPRGAAE